MLNSMCELPFSSDPSPSSLPTAPQHALHKIGSKRLRCDSVDTIDVSSSVVETTPARSEPRYPLLACPFCKNQPDLWGDIDECGTYKNPHINTIVRHHVLDKHQKRNLLLPVGDKRRIDPERFTELRNWRDKLQLKKSEATQLWTKMYMILFAVVDETSVPSPVFSCVLAERATEMIMGRLEKKIIGEPELDASDHAALLAACNKRIDERQRMERGYIHEYFGPQVQKINKLYRDELVKVDARAAEDRGRLHQAYKAELNWSQPPPTASYVQYAGSAPSQLAHPSNTEWQSMTEQLLCTRTDPHVPDAAVTIDIHFQDPYASSILQARLSSIMADVDGNLPSN